MSRRACWIAFGLVVAAAACSDIASPLRHDFYEWRLIVPSASGAGSDSLSFHWPRERLPIRVWVESDPNLVESVPKAVAAWRAAFLYDEFDAAIVSDSASADIIVRAGPGAGILFSRVHLHSALAPECAGSTFLDVSDDHTQLRLPVRIFIDPRLNSDAASLSECFALTTTHELGHALGIWRHSSVPTDLMFTNPAVPGPSDRDLATMEIIYHLPANVEAVGP